MGPASFIRDKVDRAATAVADLTTRGVNKATDVAMSGKEKVQEGASNLFDKDSFELGSLKDVGASLWDGAKDVFKGEGSLGGMVAGALDTVGLPEWAGDIIGAGVDLMSMNPKGYEHLLSGLSGIAGEVGLEDLEGFLDTASSVTGMAVDVGNKAAMMYFTGGTSAAGMLNQASQTGALGHLGQVAGAAEEIGGKLETAMGAVNAFKEGDLVGAGGAILSSFGGNVGILDEVFGGLGDSGVGELVGGLLGGDGSDLLGAVFEQFGGELLSELPVGEILGELGLDHEALRGLAGPIVDIGKELASRAGESLEMPGTGILNSPAGEALREALTSLVDSEVGSILAEMGLSAAGLVNEAADHTQGMMDMAGLDEDVARDVLSVLVQLGSMAGSSMVSDMMGAQVRC